jgi:hypothetical protein
LNTLTNTLKSIVSCFLFLLPTLVARLCFAMQCERQFNMGVVTIKKAKNDVGWWKKPVKIGEIFMFYYLKPWQSCQVVSFSFIYMLRSSNRKSIW